jgi:hypothetical protein
MRQSNKYTCALCHGTFIKGRSDDEAWAEHLARNPDVVKKKDTDMVCDNCFEYVMAVEEGRASPIRRKRGSVK